MTQQTTLGTSDSPVKPQSETSNSNTSRTRSSPESNANITKLNCSDKIDAWISQIDETEYYAFTTLQARIKQSLTEKSMVFGLNYKTTGPAAHTSYRSLPHPTDETETPHHFLKLIDSLLRHLSTPYINPSNHSDEIGRAVPKSNMEIFVPDKLYDFIKIDATEANHLIQRFHDIDEITANPSKIRLYKKYNDQVNLSRSHQSGVQAHLKNIKRTIYHKLSFSSKYASNDSIKELPHTTKHNIPEPHPDLESFTLEELKIELEATREVIGQIDEYKNSLQKEKSQLETENYKSLVTTHFPEYETHLLNPE
jgi:hypothetical protein